MTTLRWDLFHEANYMETVRDERTALLEARRYKAGGNGYPLIRWRSTPCPRSSGMRCILCFTVS